VEKINNNLESIAQQPNERRLWWVRKLYNLPPTDPRYLELTTEQIDLEYEHFLLDNPELKTAQSQSYSDPDYDETEKNELKKIAQEAQEDDWEEVEFED
jgi:hypothetical protein